MLDILLLNVVMGAEGLLKIGSDDHSRTFGSSTSDEEHNTSTVVLVSGLQKTDSNTHGNTCAALRTLIGGNGPGITLKLLQDR